MQKIPLHAKEMNIGLEPERKTPWLKYIVIVIVVLAILAVLDMMGRMYLQAQAIKLKGYEANKQ